MSDPSASIEPRGAAPLPTRTERRHSKALAITGAAGALVFIGLMVGAAQTYDAVAEADGVSGLDRPALNAAIALRTPASELWVTAFTNLGSTLPMVVVGIVLTAALFLRFRRWTIWVLMLVAATGSVAFTLVGKALVGRARPPIEQAVPPYETSFSFPSGHTLNSTVVMGMLAYLVVWLVAKAWVRGLAVAFAVIWAVSMGLSRVFLGHHWLTDVMFAWLFGLGWLALLITVHQVLLRRQTDGLGRSTPPPAVDFTSSTGVG